MVQKDLIDALRIIDSSVIIEQSDPETLRVSLPGGPRMVLREDFYRQSLNDPDALLAYAERIIAKIRKEMRK
jgi:hypothetical protein